MFWQKATLIEVHPRYVPLTTSLFRPIETGGMNAITSVLTLIELLTGPKKQGLDQLAATYERPLSVFPIYPSARLNTP